MPCIVPTCLRSDKEMTTIPEDVTLASRWLEAIEIGSGYSIELAESEFQPEICSLHFTDFDTNAGSYEEPSKFISRDETCTQIFSCRMCLTFHPTEDMVSLEGTIGERTISSLLEMLGLDLQNNQFFQMICLACIARIEIFTSLQTNFTQSEIAFQDLLQKSQNIQYLEFKIEISSPQLTIVEDEEEFTEFESYTYQNASDDESIPTVAQKSWKQREKRTMRQSMKNKKSQESISLKEKIDRNCYICDTIQPDANQLMVHLTENHSSEMGYRCEECSLDIPLLYMYNRHLSRHDQSKLPLKCSICSMRFSSKFWVKLHENRIHGANHNVKPVKIKARDVVCEQCGKVCDIRRLKDHVQQVHLKTSQSKCNICGKTFTTKRSLERHMLLHTNAKPYSCDQCEENFRRLLDYRHHKSLVHDGVNPHVCSECNEEFKNYRLLYVHKQKVHQKNVPKSLREKQCETCKLCRLRFAKGSELMEHIRSVHSEEEYPVLQCPHCPKTFMLPTRLSVHKLIHSGRYACKECGAGHVDKKKLQYHMDLKHSDGRLYTCSDCPTTFTSLHQLTLHTVLHTKGKQFQCEYCEKAFLRRFQLVIHTRIHTGEKPFECVGCLKRFGDDRTFCKHKKICQALLEKKLAEPKLENV
ncbi:zinc finger protein 431-like [Wyeomyia smithii]|uniref:zinc finger protein 431-like n=1 Tax=Wyeomyia smithii TaxID=174621 RepID=UPI002467DD87|nr:zinc finger protein 431-like [Wyeomyia smithii]